MLRAQTMPALPGRGFTPSFFFFWRKRLHVCCLVLAGQFPGSGHSWSLPSRTVKGLQQLELANSLLFNSLKILLSISNRLRWPLRLANDIGQQRGKSRREAVTTKPFLKTRWRGALQANSRDALVPNQQGRWLDYRERRLKIKSKVAECEMPARLCMAVVVTLKPGSVIALSEACDAVGNVAKGT